jgi:NAD(P)-dependent dehydrogenase (short-subunit alcohol dehydrogenase family)
MELKGKSCLITGGLSGIGAATAILLAGRGANVAVATRDPQDAPLDEMRRTVEDFGGKFLSIQADVSNATDCDRCIAEAHASMGSLDVLVPAAGGPAPGGLMELSELAWQSAFNVHVHAVFRLCRAAAPLMKERGEGAIVLISSAAGLRGCMGALAYGVAKGALPQFARAMARELADHNIRVNCVSPGVIRTPFQNFLTEQQARNNIDNRIPLHREGTAGNVASLIAELIQNDFITGENVVIDGGMTMRIA